MESSNVVGSRIDKDHGQNRDHNPPPLAARSTKKLRKARPDRAKDRSVRVETRLKEG